jgi:isocitrate dehydrogenase
MSNLGAQAGSIQMPAYERKEVSKTLVGVDAFIDWNGSDPNKIGDALSKIKGYKLKLKMITNRGVKVYPQGLKETYCTDHWRCRFVNWDANVSIENRKYEQVEYEQVLALLSELQLAGFDVIKTENLYEFDGQRAFSLGQGE